MEAKFKLGDRVRYVGKERRGYPIPGKEYNIKRDATYCPPPAGVDYVVGGYEYSLIPASGNDDQYGYDFIEEKYLTLINPSRIFFG